MELPVDVCGVWKRRPAFNYSDGDLEVTREMLLQPYSLPSISDAGAHNASMCDAVACGSLLTHWVRDRSRGPKLPLEWAIQKHCRDNARASHDPPSLSACALVRSPADCRKRLSLQACTA